MAWVVQDQVKDGSETATSAEQKLYFRDLGFRIFDTVIVGVRAIRHPSNHRYGRQYHQALILSKGRPRTINLIRDRLNTTAGDPVKRSIRDKEGRLFQRTVPGKVVPPFGARGNIWFYHVGGGKTTRDKIAFGHPALMAEEVAEDLIISFSRPGELVFVHSMGQGQPRRWRC